jgi:DNA-directed RNA polymerase subunit M/transcription elongation factor TFIIS
MPNINAKITKIYSKKEVKDSTNNKLVTMGENKQKQTANINSSQQLMSVCVDNNKDLYCLNISKFNQLDEFTKMFRFKTLGSGTIRADAMYYAIKNLDRKSAIFSLERYVSIGVADAIERGILEFTLIQISSEGFDVIEFISNIYKSKISDICVNLDSNNKRINNQSLRESLMQGGLDPHFVAFMNPQQLHPARWTKELEKQRNIEDANNNKKVTDIYKCYKCHNRNSTTTQMQTRSADEPMTIFVTCLTCYNTFTTQ